MKKKWLPLTGALLVLGLPLVSKRIYQNSNFDSNSDSNSEANLEAKYSDELPRDAVAAQRSQRIIASQQPAPTAEKSAAPTLAPETSAPVTKTAATVEEFLQKLSPSVPWKFHRDESQRIYSMMGGLIPGIADSPSKTLSFAQELALYSGVEADQVKADAAFAENQKNPMNVTHNFKQEYGGYEVYDSYLRVFARSSDHGIYFINNELKEVGRPALEISVGATAIPGLVGTLLVGKTYSIERTSQKPFLYVQKPGQSELAWKVIVKIEAPLKDRREILISARSGEILQNMSLTVNN